MNSASVLSPPPPGQGPAGAPPGAGLPRLLAAGPDLAAHQRRFGPLPSADGHLADLAGQAGLFGRGGAAFPTARKLAAVAAAARSRRGAAVVANGAEGEPLSAKDKVLLTRSPHLVLDGLTLAASAVGADRRLLAIEDGNPAVEHAVRLALAERGGPPVEVVLTPRRYVSGQETALVDLIDGGPGRPTLHRPFERGIDRRPTLVDNVETLAHLALVARYGPDWFRRIGTPAHPGSALATVAGDVTRPGVYEIAAGHGLADLLRRAGAGQVRGVLVGGYFGHWIGGGQIGDARLEQASLAALGASLGCGVIAAIGEETCALDEVSRVTAWFAASSAGQCGGCTWGLRDLALAAESVNSRPDDRAAPADIARWAAMVRGRGACALPDGAAGFLTSALDVFAAEVRDHQAGRCRRRRAGLLPTPPPEPWP